MSAPYFKLADPSMAILDGNQVLDSSVTTVYNGYLMAPKQGATTLVISTGSPSCMMVDNLALQEFPTDDNIATYRSNNYVGTAFGRFRIVAGSGLFTGAGPTREALIYDDGTGLLTVTAASGKSQVGRCLAVLNHMAPGVTSGSNTNTENLFLLSIELDTINNRVVSF